MWNLYRLPILVPCVGMTFCPCTYPGTQSLSSKVAQRWLIFPCSASLVCDLSHTRPLSLQATTSNNNAGAELLVSQLCCGSLRI